MDDAIHSPDGYFRVFVHGSGTRAKTYYGGGMVSSYFMVWDAGEVELVLGLAETVMVDRRESRCQEDAGYNQKPGERGTVTGAYCLSRFGVCRGVADRGVAGVTTPVLLKNRGEQPPEIWIFQ